MGTLHHLDDLRRRRDQAGQVRRLELAIVRLDPAVRRPPGSITPKVERELAAIAGAVAAGDHGRAADRAERLLGLLGHPAMSG